MRIDKHVWSLVSAIALAFTLSGCIYVHETRRPDGSTVMEVNTTGWYLLSCAPIAAGDPDDEESAVWFEDTCTLDTNVKVLSRHLAKRQAKLPPGQKLRVGPITTHENLEGVLLFLINRHEFRSSVVIYDDPVAVLKSK